MGRTNGDYTQELLKSWEEVYKKGQLTLWIMLALKDGPKHMSQIKTFIDHATNTAFSVDDKSMYRALRRYYETELTDFETAPGKGPEKKIYRLSPIGDAVLTQFIKRNILDTIYKPEIKSLIEKKN